ncbi:DUF1772 domain-containing protein [Pseudooceanicola sp. MF1-13]|uniref:anthrone oxygenase family protein n=1 Tax=Pseudooceanicola sp. MF1-13 TaxID=3379095 RepID=UPI0038913919
MASIAMERSMGVGVKAPALVSLILTGAIFGFFYAWVCSTMWGLDATDPRVAIQAMQAMNGSVRNAVFAPAFFGTGPVLLITAFLAWKAGNSGAGSLFAVAGVIYIVAAMMLTMMVNVPMNEALALVDVPADVDAAQATWTEYSGKWQVYNIARTVASGFSLMSVGIAFLRL